MYFNANPGRFSPYVYAVDFLSAQNPKEIGLYLPDSSFSGSWDYGIWSLLREKVREMPRVKYVGVINDLDKLHRDSDVPPRFIFSDVPPRHLFYDGPFSTLEGEPYSVVWQSPPVTILETTKSSKETLERWKRNLSDMILLIRSNLEVYLDRNENRLVYVKDQCRSARTFSTQSSQLPAEPLIFLHLIPADVDDLPDHRKRYQFDNLDFRFDDYRIDIQPGELCISVRKLPAYDIVGIRSGEYTDEGRLWGADVSLNE